MPDILDATGLTIKTADEIRVELESGLRGIFGDDINLDQNSPDGQTVGLYQQAAIDVRELIASVYASFNPDRATGTILDERGAWTGAVRQAGSFTIVPITIVTDRTVNLAGLDGAATDVNGVGFTVQDNAGNKFILLDSVTLGVGTVTLNFRAQVFGQIETTIGTINNQVTVVLGVVSVNNAVGNLQTGSDEETDAAFRLRRQRSVALSSAGYLNGLYAALLALDGVTDARVYENDTDVTDSRSIPAHTIWVIVEGGANTDIANEIYARKTAGGGTKGAQVVTITSASGDIRPFRFDRPAAKPLYIRFQIKQTKPGAAYDTAGIQAFIVNNLNYNIGDAADTSTVTAYARAAINATGGSGLPIAVEISKDGVTWLGYLPVDALNEQWVLDAGRITITVTP